MRNILIALIGSVFVAFVDEAAAQTPPPPPPTTPFVAPPPLRLGFDGIDTSERRFLDSLTDQATASGEAAVKGRRLVAAMSVPCDVTSAVERQNGRMRVNTGRQKVESYELVCRDGLGWIVTDFERQPDEAFDCMALATLAAINPRTTRCALAANSDPKVQLGALVRSTGSECELRDARYIGTGGTPPIRRYETLFEGGSAYILDVPDRRRRWRP